MVDAKSVAKQLKRIGFNTHGWGRTEVNELQHILLEDEEIYEAVNGIYEGGFALMVATDIRLLLIDKKPLNYLSIEDMRYELISEIDYNHRLIGAYISLSSGLKDLKFSSLNQHRLRKLISHVQHCMAAGKKKESNNQEDQNQHLEQINQQLQSYLAAQYKQQQKLQEQLQNALLNKVPVTAELPQTAAPVRPEPQLSDYLFAQSLLEQHKAEGKAVDDWPSTEAEPEPGPTTPAPAQEQAVATTSQLDDLYSEGRKEIFAKAGAQTHKLFEAEINPLKIAYSKLPMALRNRRFGRPRFHAHSQEAVSAPTKA